MTTEVTINNEKRIAILFPDYDDTKDCIEAMADAMWQVLDVIVSCEESKSMISADSLNQLVKLNRMLNDKDV